MGSVELLCFQPSDNDDVDGHQLIGLLQEALSFRFSSKTFRVRQSQPEPRFATLHSFKQIEFFAANSLSLYADFDSARLAPTDAAASNN